MADEQTTPPGIYMETKEIHRRELQAGMWLMPWYDKQTGRGVFNNIPIPEQVLEVRHGADDTEVIVRDHETQGRAKRWFTDTGPNNEFPEIVL